MKLSLCGVFLMSLMSARAVAQSPFDGTWKGDVDDSQTSTRPRYNFLLQEGIYHCTTCDPPVEVKADGRDHKITGDPCFDSVSVGVLDALTTSETYKKNGTTMRTTKVTVSPDGNTATREWTESCNVNRDVVAGKDLLTRVQHGPPGSHAMSGSWRLTKRMSRSENALIATLKLEGDTFSFSDPAGQGYAAKLDGTEAPIKGSLSNTLVSVKQIDQQTIQETDTRDGKVVEVIRFTVSADGKTLTISMENKANGSVSQFIARKQ